MDNQLAHDLQNLVEQELLIRQKINLCIDDEIAAHTNLSLMFLTSSINLEMSKAIYRQTLENTLLLSQQLVANIANQLLIEKVIFN